MGNGAEWIRLNAAKREAKIREYTDKVLRMGSTTSVELVKKHVHSAILNDGWIEGRISRDRWHQWDNCDKFYSYKGVSGNHTKYHGIIQAKIDAHKALQDQIAQDNDQEIKNTGAIETVNGYVGPNVTAENKKSSWAIWLILGAALLLVVALFKRKKS